MGQIKVVMPPDLHKQLKQIALDQDISLRQLVENVLTSYAKKKGK